MVDVNELKKVYYSISEVAEMFDVNQSLLRFWEKEFPKITPTKNKKGNRLYSKKEIKKIKEIHQLVKVEGHTLKGAKLFLKTNSNKKESGRELYIKLMDIKNELEKIKQSI